jgi:2-iminobutanoate/2-iminopropanoate deaminase
MLFSSAISGIDPNTGKPATCADEQVRLVFLHIQSLLKEAGVSSKDVGHLSFHIRDNTLRDPINEEWCAAFPDQDDRPARHISLSDTLAGPLHIQAELIAVIPQGE